MLQLMPVMKMILIQMLSKIKYRRLQVSVYDVQLCVYLGTVWNGVMWCGVVTLGLVCCGVVWTPWDRCGMIWTPGDQHDVMWCGHLGTSVLW